MQDYGSKSYHLEYSTGRKNQSDLSGKDRKHFCLGREVSSLTTMLVWLTKKINKIKKTVLSRCHVIYFPYIK